MAAVVVIKGIPPDPYSGSLLEKMPSSAAKASMPMDYCYGFYDNVAKSRTTAALEAKVAKLNEDLDKANQEMRRTQDEADLCENGLGGEKIQMAKAAEDLQSLYDHLPEDILISCGVIAYLLPLTINIVLCVWMTDIAIQNWNINGLPNDVFSTENAIISANSSRYSLFIDLRGRPHNWIKILNSWNMVIGYNRKCTRGTRESLDPILLHKTFTQGGHQNPHFLPETFNKVTIINFALTQSALRDQLLSIFSLSDAENMILKTLTCSEGDILENEGAIQILGESKTLSIDIVAKQEASKETSTKIEAFRLNYKPVPNTLPYSTIQ
ncbi:axonemal, Dynein heavy chain 7 [Lucilia cuprina]|nr:axonemal, Dynein heavy chain 7 [Lucilia cuprina]